MQSRVLLIDFDETLVPTSHKYIQANDLCLEILERHANGNGPPQEEILKIRRRLDDGLMQRYAYHPERFPSSWTMTYRQLIDRHGYRYESTIVQQLTTAARTYRNGPFTPYAGVVEALETLQQVYQLRLVTGAKHAEAFQHQKIIDSKLGRYFRQHIYITGLNKTDQYRELLHRQPLRGVVIGDSPKHDIGPGQDVGAWTIQVGHNPWSFTHADVTPDFTVDAFAQVPDIVRSLQP